MLTVERDGEPLPLPHLYAATLAEWLGYGKRVDDPPRRKHYWLPDPTPAKLKGFYGPKIEATPVDWALFDAASMVRVYMTDVPGAEGAAVHVGMLGEPWEEERLFAVLAALRGLPHAAEVREAVLAKADWLDANPMYRGLSVKARSATKHRVHVDALEV